MTHCMNYDPKKRPFFRAIVRDIDMLGEKSKLDLFLLQLWSHCSHGNCLIRLSNEFLHLCVLAIE